MTRSLLCVLVPCLVVRGTSAFGTCTSALARHGFVGPSLLPAILSVAFFECSSLFIILLAEASLNSAGVCMMLGWSLGAPSSAAVREACWGSRNCLVGLHWVEAGNHRSEIACRSFRSEFRHSSCGVDTSLPHYRYASRGRLSVV